MNDFLITVGQGLALIGLAVALYFIVLAVWDRLLGDRDE
jgi:hypothetical protein